MSYVIFDAVIKRLVLNFALIFLFAFAQIGAVTHAISHVDDYAKHNQQGKNSHSEQCGQCLSFAKIGGGIATQGFVLPNLSASFMASVNHQTSHSSQLRTVYAARAPPITHFI